MMFNRNTYIFYSIIALISACTTPPEPGSGGEYQAACPEEGCPAGTTCDEASGTCVEEPAETCVDADDDGYGQGCALGSDCDDNDYFTNPSVSEICDELDNNCDGRVNEGGVCDSCEIQCTPGAKECLGDTGYRECITLNGCTLWKPTVYCEAGCLDGACFTPCDDFDRDSYGEGCEAGPDCNDRNPFAFPGNPEVCDGYDNDCDGSVDEDDICDMPCEDLCTLGDRACTDDLTAELTCLNQLSGCTAWVETRVCDGARGEICLSDYCEAPGECSADLDNDGYAQGCPQGDGEECNPYNGRVAPGSPEVCDGLDNDCDGQVDEGAAPCPPARCDNPASTPEAALSLDPTALVSEELAIFTCPGQPTWVNLGVTPRGAALLASASRDGVAGGPVTLALLRQGADGSMTELVERTGHAAMLQAAEEGQLFLRLEHNDAAPAPLRVRARQAVPGRCDAVSDDNNSPGAADHVLADLTVLDATCGVDLDFFALDDVARYQTISADLIYSDPTRELALQLWRDSEPQTPDQRLEPGRRHAHLRSDLPGSWQVLVQQAQAGPPQSYILAVHTWQNPSCTDDAFENNSANDRIAGASPITDNFDNPAILCPGDLDWYDIGDFQEGQAIDVIVNFDAARLNLDARLFFEDLNGLTQVAIQDTAPEFLPINAPRSGHYYVMVQGRAPSDTGPYTIVSRRR